MILSLLETLLLISRKHTKTIMLGYMHLQKAQPITFSHHLMAYTQMFQRDHSRLGDCYRRVNIMPLGSGALAGNPYPIDRYFVANELGFPDITYNSIDGASDRDFVIEISADLSIVMMPIRLEVALCPKRKILMFPSSSAAKQGADTVASSVF